ncbi:MAG: phospholipase D-like domain-containing protein [Candidatus Bathyarchaeia archaeon]
MPKTTLGISEVKFLDGATILNELEQSLEESQIAKIAVAYIGLNGFNEISRQVERFLENNKQLHMIVGISNYHITEWQALLALVKLKEKFRNFKIKYFNNECFHPKLFLFESSELSKIIVGSSNLTGAGLGKNVEANTLIKVMNRGSRILASIQEFWQSIWESAEPLTIDVVRKYKASFPVRKRSSTNTGLPKTFMPRTQTPSSLSPASNYWKIAPGKQGWKWPEWKKAIKAGRGYVAIGWGDIGNLKDLTHASKSEFINEVKKRTLKSKYESDPNYVAGQFWRFCREMQYGHVIVAYSKKTIFGIGYVDGEYYYENNDEDYPHRRPVKWTKFPEFRIQKKIWRHLATNNVINAIRNPIVRAYIDRLIV